MRNLFAGILMALGLLICGTSGLCTLGFLIMGAMNTAERCRAEDLLAVLGMAAVVGGIPFAIGLFMYVLGKHANR